MTHWKYAILALLLVGGLQTVAQVNPSGDSAGHRKALHEAIQAQDVEKVRTLLADGVNVNEDFLGRIPLHDAVYGGNEAIIEMLILSGANVNRQDSDGRTALHMYIGYARQHRRNTKDIGVVELLLAHGARIDTKGRGGSSPVETAVSRSRPDIVTALLKKAQNITIHQAAYIGRWERIEALLASGTDINEKDAQGRTPLYHAACLNDQLDIVKWLLGRGADVNLGDGTTTPLYGAVCQDHYEIARVLIDHGADVNVQQPEGLTPLHVAIGLSYPQDPREIIECLVAHGARVDLKNNWGKTPIDVAIAENRSDTIRFLLGKVRDKTIHQAAHVGEWERVEFLLGNGTDIDERDQEGCTALHHAVWGNQLDVAERLIARGADINAAQKDGLTPHHVAATRGYPKMTQLLLRHGAHAALKDQAGETPLHKAASGYVKEETWPGNLERSDEQLEVVKLLLARGASVNLGSTGENSTALHIAARHGSIAMARLLLERGAQVNAKDRYGRTPLFCPIDGESQRLILRSEDVQGMAVLQDVVGTLAELMIDKGAEVNAGDEGGRTPLHYAAESGYPDVVLMLLRRGAEVDAKDNAGDPPILVSDDPYVVAVLTTHGAQLNARDNKGQTALVLALKRNDPYSAKVLIDQNADIDTADTSGWTPLHHAIEEGNEEMALLLIDKGADAQGAISKHVFDSLNESTPLHLAAKTGCIRVASRLIEEGAGINAVAASGRTPLHVAIEWSNEEVALLLIAKGADIHARIGKNNAESSIGTTPLHLTARQGCIQVASRLIEKGANVNALDDAGAIPAHLAVEYNQPGLFELLLKNGADIHLKTKQGNTLLREAVRRAQTNPDIVKALIDKGATVTPTIQSLMDSGKTQLQLAVEANDVSRIMALTRQEYFKEQVNFPCQRLPNCPTPLATAVDRGYAEVARLLLQQGADISYMDSAKQTLLFHAAESNKTKLARILIDNGANVNQVDMFEETPLHMAAWLGHKEMVQLLLENGTNVNAVMRTKGQGSGYNARFTPLHNAALGKKAEIVKLLIANGADVNAKDARGLTALDQAAMQDDAVTFKILEAAGAQGQYKLKQD